MIKEKTVLILGAGASAPYGFPLGDDLQTKVIKNLRGQTTDSVDYPHILEGLGHFRNRQKEFADALHDANLDSVDAFLFDRGEEFGEIGKAAIAASLIRYEDLNDLKKKEYQLPPDKQRTRWYHYLLNLLGPLEEFQQSNLSVVTFNYDRSLDYYIFETIGHRFGLRKYSDKVIGLMKKIPIVHFYGSLGTPDFMEQPGGRSYLPEVTPEQVEICIKNMNLMFEKQDDVNLPQPSLEAHNLIAHAEKLVFIGFGFHNKNLERLKIGDIFNGESIISGNYRRGVGEIKRERRRLSRFSRKEKGRSPRHSWHEFSALEFLKERDDLR